MLQGAGGIVMVLVAFQFSVFKMIYLEQLAIGMPDAVPADLLARLEILDLSKFPIGIIKFRPADRWKIE